MSGFQWHAADVGEVQRVVREAGRGSRKCRLFCVACCDRQPDRLGHPRSVELVRLSEEYADGAVTDRQLRVVREEVHRWAMAGGAGAVGYDEWFRRWAAWAAAKPRIGAIPPMAFIESVPSSRELLADIYGDPFRPVAFDPGWRTEPVVALARQMYEVRDFGPMPVLADALDDAGCDQPDILSHCRGPGPHVRGCWVVDLVLGQS